MKSFLNQILSANRAYIKMMQKTDRQLQAMFFKNTGHYYRIVSSQKGGSL